MNIRLDTFSMSRFDLSPVRVLLIALNPHSHSAEEHGIAFMAMLNVLMCSLLFSPSVLETVFVTII